MTYKRRSKSSRLNLGLKFIGLVAGLMLVNWFYRSARMSQWSGRDDFSWVEQQADNLTVHSLIPEYEKAITWIIPGNTLVTAAFGAGEYQWKNVFALGEIDGRGGPMLERTSQDALGLKVSGWRAGRKTNLSWLDQWRWWYWTTFKTKHRSSFDLSESGAWEATDLPDGSRAFVIVNHRLDQLINQETFSQAVAAEGLSLALENGSHLARLISNHGIDLVSVANQPELPETTTIWLKEAAWAKSGTVQWLKRLLPEAEVKINTGKDQWTAVVLAVGKDYN